jgi:uncharacterized protein (TIGR03086 family)
MEIVEFGPAAQHLAELIAAVPEGDLGRPTPCPAYTLGDLIEHVGGIALAFASAARKERNAYNERGPAGDASRLAPGWRDRIPADLAAMAGAWRDPAAWEGTTFIAGADGPAGVTGLAAADELVVHGWDVARATARGYAADPPAVAAARQFLEMFASPDAPAGPEVPFGPSRPLAAGASDLDQLVALAGRDPAWSA